MDWQDGVAWLVVALAATHLVRTLLLPAFAARPAASSGCGSGCGSCPSNASPATPREPQVFALTTPTPGKRPANHPGS